MNTAISASETPIRSSAMAFLIYGGAPAAWIVQLVTNYAIASASCRVTSISGSHRLPVWHGPWFIILAVNLLALVAGVLSSVASFRDYRAVRAGHPSVMRGGARSDELACFFSLIGTMTGFGFLAAIAFDTVALLVVPQCFA